MAKSRPGNSVSFWFRSRYAPIEQIVMHGLEGLLNLSMNNNYPIDHPLKIFRKFGLIILLASKLVAGTEAAILQNKHYVQVLFWLQVMCNTITIQR